MSRSIKVAAAQLGPIPHGPHPGSDEARAPVLQRMLVLLDQAAQQGAQLIVYPELALTTFFPRALLTDEADVAALFEAEHHEDGSDIRTAPHVRPVLDRAHELGVDVSLGYAERFVDTQNNDHKKTDYNTAIYYSAKTDAVVAKYRKVHLPGRTTLLPDAGAAQQLEKYYFTPGNLGFEAFRVPGLVTTGNDPILGLLICNDRRWPEAWRCYGLQGVELVLCGFNTTDWKPQEQGTPAEQEALSLLHHHISCQSGSYENACFSVHVAKAGIEADGPGGGLIAGTVIYDPLGRKVAETKTKDDELLVETLDLTLCQKPKAGVFNFQNHRRVEHYGRLVNQTGVIEPEQK